MSEITPDNSRMDETLNCDPPAAFNDSTRVKNWKLRYDAAMASCVGETLSGRDVLGFFRKQSRRNDAERRSSLRVPAVERYAWLGWWEDEEFLIAPAVLDNISLGGVRLTLTKPIPVDQPCWLCLGPPCPVVCVRSVVVGVGRAQEEYDVRLAFTMKCPDQFYEIVVNGYRGRR